MQAGSGGSVAPAYADVYGYDPGNNRVLKTVNGGSGQTGGSTIQYTCNGDTQLVDEVGTGALAYETISTYETRKRDGQENGTDKKTGRSRFKRPSSSVHLPPARITGSQTDCALKRACPVLFFPKRVKRLRSRGEAETR